MNKLSLNERHKWLLTKANIVVCSKPTSVITSDTIYSKDHWLKKEGTTSPTSMGPNNNLRVNLDEHIQQCSQKMKNLHQEYLTTIEKCNNGSHNTTLIENPILKRPQSDFLAQSSQIIPPTVTKLSDTLNNYYSTVFNTFSTIKNTPIDQFIAKK